MTFKPSINKNLSSLRRDTVEESIDSIVRHVEDIYKFLDYLYNLKVVSGSVDRNGLPKSGSVCSLLGGEYISLTSTGPGCIIPLDHTLGRVPQGVIWTYLDSNARPIIKADEANNIPGATDKVVYIYMDGAAGDVAVGVLI